MPNNWINDQKSDQNWLKREGDKFLFPGGGTMFPKGVGSYVDQMQDLIPSMKDGKIRTAIDTGCGVSILPQLILSCLYDGCAWCMSKFCVLFSKNFPE